MTDAGLIHLRGLENLEVLDLQNTAISDAGLEHLAGMIELRLLFLDGTRSPGRRAEARPGAVPVR